MSFFDGNPGHRARNLRFPNGAEYPAELDLSGIWLDATDSATLYTDNGVTNVTTSGDQVQNARDKLGRALTWRRTVADFFIYQTNVVNGKSVLRAPAASATRTFGLEVTAGPGSGVGNGVALNLSQLVSAAACTQIMAVNLTVDATPRQIFGDSAGGFYFIRASSGAELFRVANFDGTTDAVVISPSAGTWRIFTARHLSGQLQVRSNGGAWVSVASGNTSTLTNPVRIGRGFTAQCMIGDLAHLATWNTGLSDAECSAVERYFGAQLGITIP